MSHWEAMRWLAYFRKHGYSSANRATVPQLQQGFALLASILVNVNGGYKGGKQAKITDFLPSEEMDKDGQPEDVAALLASLWSGKRKDGVPERKLWKRSKRR
jgi:hypothetical protein